jgi:hypothetical protein
VGEDPAIFKRTHSKLHGGGFKLLIPTRCATIFNTLFKNKLVAGQKVI